MNAAPALQPLVPRFVGREEESLLLRRQLSDARKGRGSVVVKGEAGLGKTRLLEELAPVARAQECLFLTGTGTSAREETAISSDSDLSRRTNQGSSCPPASRVRGSPMSCSTRCTSAAVGGRLLPGPVPGVAAPGGRALRGSRVVDESRAGVGVAGVRGEHTL